jgi:hypothetical protein
LDFGGYGGAIIVGLELGRSGGEGEGAYESKTKTRMTAPTGIPSSKVLKVEKPKP